MKRGLSRGLVVALAGILVVALAGIAGAKIKTKTFSSGTINQEFDDFETATHEFDLNKKKFKRSKVRDVDVAVRIRSTCSSALDLVLSGPRGRSVILSTDNHDEDFAGGDCNFMGPQNFVDAYGSGAEGCSGTLTEFNDEAETPVEEGAQPWNGQFLPEEPLREFDGGKVKGAWTVSVRDDDEFNDASTLYCAELEVKYKKKKKRK
jgi:hypothetical protein